jgi:cytochrome c-type biogenesis protein CcmE
LTRRGRRLSLIAVALVVVGASAAIALYSLRDNIVFFYSPTEVVQKALQAGARLRVGGLVKPDSLIKLSGENVAFVVTDGANELTVAYQGLLPDLFREGQGVVAEGVLEARGQMRAETILAKHDERYMPREVVEALKKQGRWQEGEGVAKP